MQNRGEFVLDAALEHLTAGGDDGKLLRTEGQHVQDGVRPGSGLHGVHLFLLDHQRDDAGAGQLLAFFHGHITVDGGDHHLGRAVHSQQCGAVDLEQAVAVGDQLDLALFRFGAVDVFAGSSFVQQGRCLVLMQDAGALFPDIEVFFADGQQHWDVLGLDDVPLAEARALELARDDLGDIVAEHLPCRVNSADQFHLFNLLTTQAAGSRRNG